MRDIKNTRAALLFALFLLPAAFGFVARAQKIMHSPSKVQPPLTVDKGSILKPDFAFPADVNSRALPAYEEALRDGDAVKAMLCAMQLNVAGRLISSNDSILPALSRYERIARQSRAPFSGLAKLLEARLLAQAYSADSRRYNQRVLPADSLSEEPTLWSGEQFRARISSLINEAMNESGQMYATPISEIALIIDGAADAEKVGMTVLDFATYQAVSLLNQSGISNAVSAIPFMMKSDEAKESSGAKIAKESRLSDTGLFMNLISHDAANSKVESGRAEALLIARLELLNTLEGEERSDYMETFLHLYPRNSQLRPLLLVSLYRNGMLQTDSQHHARETYTLLKDAADRFPDNTLTPCIKSYMADLMNSSINLTSDEQWIPGRKGRIAVEARNVDGYKILLVPISAQLAESRNLEIRRVVANGPVAVVGEISAKSEEPTWLTDTLTFDMRSNPLKPGYYVIVPSTTNTLAGIPSTLSTRNPAIVNVSAISSFTSKTVDKTLKTDKNNRVDTELYLYVSDAETNAPVKGATVKFTDTSNGRIKKNEVKTFTTNSDGCVAVPFTRCDAVITHSGSRLTTSCCKYSEYVYKPEKLRANLFTDLALYHPGDSLRVAAVVANLNSPESTSLLTSYSPAESLNLNFTFYDANGKKISEQAGVADRSGRATAGFLVPKAGLTGRFRVELTDDNRILTNAYVDVAEYKSPTFLVMLDQPEVAESEPSGNALPDEVKISGSVTTFTGMPLADSDLQIDIEFQRFRWRNYFGSIPSSYGAKVTTDSRGRFELVLGVGNLYSEGYGSGYFTVTASATSAAGETQQSASRRFSLGAGSHINAANRQTIKVESAEIPLKIKVENFLGNPEVKELNYTVKNESGAIVEEGSFMSPILKLAASKYPSGRYTIQAILKDASRDFANPENPVMLNDTLNMTLTLWREDDRQPPYQTALWAPERTVYVPAGADKVKVKVGESYEDGMIFCQISDVERVIERRWLKLKGKNGEIEMPAPMKGNSVSVQLYGMRDLKRESSVVTVLPASDSVKMVIETVTFRDRINPQTHESWKFRMHPSSGLLRGGAAMAVLSNAALNSIAPFNWSYNLGDAPYSSVAGSVSARNNYSISFYTNIYQAQSHSVDCMTYALPQWNFWGYDSYRNIRVGGVRLYKSRAMATSAPADAVTMNSMAVNDMAVEMVEEESVKYAAPAMGMAVNAESSSDESAEDGGTAAERQSVEPQIRDMECPLAFFMPNLNPDSEGVVDVDFEVPNFNTTWQLQLLCYDEDMLGAVRTLESVASKPVMVSTNMPRFLRTGDKASISATLFNNTEDTLPISGSIEIFDLSTGTVLAMSESPEDAMAPSASRVLTVKYNVPANLSAVGVRAMARSSKGADGEEGLLVILPSSQPVADAYTFYLQPAAEAAELTLPKMPNGGTVTLNYCNNPAWYVLTALSGILTPDSESALVAADALYANSISSGLIEKSPKLKEGLQSLFSNNAADSLLISPLQKNLSLKIADLGATPWVNNAETETARMASLESLLDADKADEVISAMIDKLAQTQTPKGGWSWMKEMPASLYITNRVLSRIASLKESGYLPASSKLEAMIRSGLGYADSEMSREWQEIVNKHKTLFPLTRAIDYLNMRSELTDASPSGYILSMSNDLDRRLPQEWRSLSIRDKASAAIYLQRRGKPELAKEILRSVSQYASYKPSKGIWFDNAEGLLGCSKLAIAARCLQAFAAVQPEAKTISGLCQYLVLSRQTEDWNNDTGVADVAQVAGAVLAAVPEWISGESSTEKPGITLDGVPVVIPGNTESLTGGFYISLPAEEVSSKTLKVERTGASPAWGGVICQYVADIVDVKAQAAEQLKVEKMLLPITVDASGTSAGAPSKSFHKGERIRVTLTITTDRDLDYVLLRDNRAACLEPKEQLTRYYCKDGLWVLEETRDCVTNFYFTRLPKGRSIVTYEVTADRDGEYSCGIAEAQSQYYPLITSHSAGASLTITD